MRIGKLINSSSKTLQVARRVFRCTDSFGVRNVLDGAADFVLNSFFFLNILFPFACLFCFTCKSVHPGGHVNIDAVNLTFFYFLELVYFDLYGQE